MPDPEGQFVWYELMTTDIDAASAFYTEAIGWHATDSGMPGIRYTILHAGPTPVGGLMQMPPPVQAAGGRPGWGGYIGVDDVDAMAARVTQAGGSVHRAPEDIPGVGRFAVVADPQHAMFTLFKPSQAGQAPDAPAQGPGHIGWHELRTTDWPAAFAFYEGLFGWTKTQAIDMGPMGTYQTFATAAGGAMAGGIMSVPGGGPSPGWQYYITVDDIAAALGRIARAGGTVQRGPDPVPGGAWVAQCTDPEGVRFAITSPSNAG